MNITTKNTTITMSNRQTEKIKLWGIVQGVGFRPFVAKIADRLDMKGQVLNIGGLVEITVTDTPSRIDSFVDTLVAEKPGPSEIVHIKRTVLGCEESDDPGFADFADFEIIRSDEGDDEAAMIPADLAICPHCLKELYDSKNPRYQHPFISCQICGPRYTIIDRIPYDRDNTSMIDFPMCGFCESEYTDLKDRRHHAQTISCHDCGPQLMCNETRSGVGSHCTLDCTDDGQILDRAADMLKNDGVIAFKSVGGYNLVADPFNKEAVRKLREIKHRESKPFAVMFRSLDEIRKYCHVDEVEAKLLESSARPIILLEHKLKEMDGMWMDDLKRSRFVGSFLPSFAAQYMLLDRISPLIFTSANPSDMPMIKDEEEMAAFTERVNAEETLIDEIIYNRRNIRIRMDDSVTRVIDDQPQMIRRSKGYAPVPLYLEPGSQLGGRCILATGGQLKNSFALSKGPFAYMSQYFGDMDSMENQNIYKENISRMAELFRIKPDMVVCDMHPLYFTTGFAEEYAKTNSLPLLKVQHHHAHVASVMAENSLKGSVIGVSFDGTGYGTDGNIWGGEFLLCEGPNMQRMAHLKYVEMIGGDSSMKDALRSALSYVADRDSGVPADEDGCRQIMLDISDIISYGRDRVCAKPDAELILKAIAAKINTVKSSSMGRLFDAVSCLLGISDYNDHEGKCAILLEDAAAFAKAQPGENYYHPGCDAPDCIIPAKACELALKFHESIIDMILENCIEIREKTGASQVALTGGTFQNKILMEGVLEKLRDAGFEAYYNISVSPNDGGIALGQSFIAMHSMNE